MTLNVLMGTLNPTHSLTDSLCLRAAAAAAMYTFSECWLCVLSVSGDV